jgi:membrane protease YdiL (CAAX protease family)
MAQAHTISRHELPRWRRIVDFPLVTMIIAVGIFALLTVTGMLLGDLVPPGPRVERAPLLALINIPIGLLVYKFAIARLGERPRDELSLQGAFRSLGLGFIAGMLLFSAVVGVAAIANVYQIVGYAGVNGHVIGFLAIAMMAGFTEEMLFRGILFRWIEEFAGSWIALGTTSALFGLAHMLNPHASWFAAFAIAMEAGLLLGGAYMLTRSLWLPIGLHAAWNFTQGTIFDVPVSGAAAHGILEAELSGPELISGGAFGLEASLIALVIASAAGIALVVLAKRSGNFMPPSWVRRRLLGETAV